MRYATRICTRKGRIVGVNSDVVLPRCENANYARFELLRPAVQETLNKIFSSWKVIARRLSR